MIIGSDYMKRIILLFISILFITGCTKEEKQLVCEKGNLINGKCEIVESIDVSLKCREGYTLNEETKKCENTITIAAKQVSKCPDGYFIGSDLWCFSEKEYPKEVKLNCTSPNIKDDDLFSTTYVLLFQKMVLHVLNLKKLYLMQKLKNPVLMVQKMMMVFVVKNIGWIESIVVN